MNKTTLKCIVFVFTEFQKMWIFLILPCLEASKFAELSYVANDDWVDQFDQMFSPDGLDDLLRDEESDDVSDGCRATTVESSEITEEMQTSHKALDALGTALKKLSTEDLPKHATQLGQLLTTKVHPEHEKFHTFLSALAQGTLSPTEGTIRPHSVTPTLLTDRKDFTNSIAAIVGEYNKEFEAMRERIRPSSAELQVVSSEGLSEVVCAPSVNHADHLSGFDQEESVATSNIAVLEGELVLKQKEIARRSHILQSLSAIESKIDGLLTEISGEEGTGSDTSHSTQIDHWLRIAETAIEASGGSGTHGEDQEPKDEIATLHDSLKQRAQSVQEALSAFKIRDAPGDHEDEGTEAHAADHGQDHQERSQKFIHLVTELLKDPELVKGLGVDLNDLFKGVNAL